MSRSNTVNSAASDPQHHQQFQQIIQKWEKVKADPAHIDPTEVLCEMADILEKAQDRFLMKDPDPFEERHPSRIDPECPFGLILKTFFKKDPIMTEILTSYLRDNYFTRLGQSKPSFDLNVAACRVVLGILPALEVQVLGDTEGLVKRLFNWAMDAKEPLQSYATGLLAVAMEIQDIATETEFRALNDNLIPVMIKRLKSLKMQKEGPIVDHHQSSPQFKRPFQMFSPNSPSKSPSRRMSADHEDSAMSSSSSVILKSSERALNPGWPSLPSPSYNTSSVSNSDWSNSSWAEMETVMIGHFPIYPLTLSAQKVFILRYLQPLAEYQEFLQHIVDENMCELLYEIINLRENRDARLSFEGLRFMCALFCHKKICMEWVQNGGIQMLIDIPRPSIAATAVSQCLYYLSCDDPCMEKVCQLPQHVLQKMIKYVLWLIECSHESGKQWAVNFFGLACSFRGLLSIIDELDGIRVLYNFITTLPTMSNEDEEVILTDDQEYAQRQCLRCIMVALKRYFETHLALKADQLRRAYTVLPQPSQSHHKPIRCSALQVQENIDTMYELMPFRYKWSPVDHFFQLGGVPKCFQVIANAYDWTFTGRSEMVRSALEVLAICSISPKAQSQFCEQVELADRSKSVAFTVLLGAAEGELVQDAADVQRAALHVIINCVCAPINRPNGFNRGAGIITGSAKKLKPTGKTSEDLINKVWSCVRSNNGIMVLLTLLHIKTPLTDADSIRALACKALVGLARSPAAQQIMSKLPIFTNNELQQLVREPVLQDKRAEHVKFQQNCWNLIKSVSSPGDNDKILGESDYSLEMLHRASVVAQTKITFPKKQLLQLIQEYLSSSGLHETASVLSKEASLALMTSKQLTHKMTTPITTPSVPRQLSSLPNSLMNGPTSSTSSVSCSTSKLLNYKPQTAVSRNNISPRNILSTQIIPPNTTPSTPTSSKEPLNIKLKRKDNSTIGASSLMPATNGSISSPGAKSLQKIYDVKNCLDTLPELPPNDEGSNRVNLVSIVCDYLSAQHSLCKNPMVTCPEFDLFAHHKCPGPRPKHSAPWNLTSRMMQRQTFPPFGGFEGRKLDRKFLYSRFRPIRTFRCAEDQDAMENSFYSCAIMPPDDTFVLAGTYLGDVKMFNLKTGTEESSYNCHGSQVTNLEVNKDGTLLLTSSAWRLPYSKLWSLGEFFETKLTFKDDDYVEFSKVNQDKVIATETSKASIFDIQTGQKVLELKPQISNDYQKNRATFDPSDELVLNDGVLFDTRAGKEIKKLDKLNQNLNGVFHPNGLEIVSNSEVWDLRTFHLLKTVPGLDQCSVKFTNNGDIIYAVALEQETDDGEKYESAFKTFDARDYSSIATFETRRGVVDLSTSHNDLRLAVVENSLSPQITEESVVRLYDVGRLRAEEEDYDDMDDDDDNPDENEGMLLGDDDDEEDDDGFGLGSGSESDEDFSFDDLEDLADEDEDASEDEEEAGGDETSNSSSEAGGDVVDQVAAEEGQDEDEDDQWEDIEMSEDS